MDEVDTARHRTRISLAIRDWMMALNDYPGWREWNRGKVSRTLWFDDAFLRPTERPQVFEFDEETNKQHALLMRYFSLFQTSAEMRDLEYYFRRFPFSGTPVTRYGHLSNVCELYFSRIYQYKERLKEVSDALKAAVPNHGLAIGKFIKSFDKEFAAEMRERHGIHHRERFEDLTISRVFLIESIVLRDADLASKAWTEEHRTVYRKAAREWAKRCVREAGRLDVFTEAVAEALLNVCPFLKVPSDADAPG